MSVCEMRHVHAPRAGWFLLGVLLPTCIVATTGRADVIVLANRTRDAIACQVIRDGGQTQPVQIAAGDLSVVSLRGPCELTYGTGERQERYDLDANSVYLFVRDERGGVDLSKIDLGGDAETFGGRALGDRTPAQALGEIPIKVLVDNLELTRREVWEKRLRSASTTCPTSCSAVADCG